ncbi:MAG: endolytic transglycosylase MltG, partial [candidate division Zixibacteria bacterium]|nr:endolytic transglycosylase MltG [candidate division Zixibacteria bacterium]
MYKYIIKALVLLTVIIIGYLYLSYAYPKDIGDKVVSVIIKPGDGFATVAEQLLDGGVVRSGLMLKLPARWRELDKKLVVGRYDFTGENSCRSVLSKLERGDFLKIRVTVYEGAPIWKVASVLAERMEVDSLEIMALSTDSLFLDSLGLPYLEGYLYPETYFFPWGTNTRQ